MTLTEILVAAQQAQADAQAAFSIAQTQAALLVSDAQAKVDAADVAVVAAQNALTAVQPHLTLIDKLEADLLAVEQDVADEIKAALVALKAQIDPFIAQLRGLFNV